MKKYIPLALIILFMALAYLLDFQHFLSFDALKNIRMELLHWKTQHPFLAPLAFILFYALMTTLSFPGGLFLTVFGGFLFGIPWAVFYVTIGATAGACAVFAASKTAFGDLLRKKTQSFLAKMRAGFKKKCLELHAIFALCSTFSFLGG